MGGLGYGAASVALILAIVLAALVAHVSLRRIDMPRARDAAPARIGA